MQRSGGSLRGDQGDFGAIRDPPSCDPGCDRVPGKTPENLSPGQVNISAVGKGHASVTVVERKGKGCPWVWDGDLVRRGHGCGHGPARHPVLRSAAPDTLVLRGSGSMGQESPRASMRPEA